VFKKFQSLGENSLLFFCAAGLRVGTVVLCSGHFSTKMRFSLSSAMVIGIISIVCANAQNDPEPFSVAWLTETGECEWLEFLFRGGLKPYTLYHAVSHAYENRSWSEEVFTGTTSDRLFTLLIAPEIGAPLFNRSPYFLEDLLLDFHNSLEIGNYTDMLRFRAVDSMGAEDTGCSYSCLLTYHLLNPAVYRD
jgi:hypothetical protein